MRKILMQMSLRRHWSLVDWIVIVVVCQTDRERERESDRRFGKPAVHGRIKPHHPPTIYTTKIFSIHASSFVFNLSLSLSLYLHLFVLYSYSISSYISYVSFNYLHCYMKLLISRFELHHLWGLSRKHFFCVIFGQIADNNRIFKFFLGFLLAKFWTNLRI